MRRARVEAVSETLKMALTELRARAQAGNFGDLPTDKLLKLVLMLETRLERETGSRRLEFSDARNLDYILASYVDVD